MPIELHLIRASDFLCIDANEHLDFGESKKALQNLALACQKRSVRHALIDLRDVPASDRPRFTNGELAALVGAFRDAGCVRSLRLAVLYRRDVYGGVRNFTFFSRMRGLQVQAFREFESAILWLWKDMEIPAEEKPGIEVPVLRRDRKRRTANFDDGIHSTVALAPVHRFRVKHP
jgi:hypothetical protein